MPKFLLVCAICFLLGSTSVSLAACWGQGEDTREITRGTIRIQSNKGPVTAYAIYEIYARGEVCERGNVTVAGGDRRYCYAVGYERKFIRKLFVRDGQGRTIDLGESSKVVPVAPQVERRGNCNALAGQLTVAFYEQQFGAARDWRREIDADKQDLEDQLGLIGNITDMDIRL